MLGQRGRPQQNLIDLDRPWQTLGCRLVTSRPATDILQVMLRSVAFCHVLLRSPLSTTTHLNRAIRRGCRGKFFDCLKICPGDRGNHGELRLSTPFPYVVLRSPSFVHGGRNRDYRGRRGHSVNVALTLTICES